MTKRAPLLKTHVGKQACDTWTGPDGTKLKLCVKSGKYGFSGSLVSKSGKDVLPVPTGEARTAREALKNAKQFLDKIATKRN